MLAAVDAHARVLSPRPLTLDATAALLLTSALGTPASEFAVACHSVTGGNPLLVRQLSDAFVAEGVDPGAAAARIVPKLAADAVSRTLALRLAGLPNTASRILRAVAVQGASADIHRAAAVAGVEPTVAAQLADSLTTVGILAAGRPLRVAHPILRSAVVNDVPLAELDQLHLRSARHAVETNGDAPEAASHLLATEPRGEGWVTEILRSAARAAVDAGAPDTAAAYLRRALREPPLPRERGEVLFELGRAEAAAREPDAITHLHDALATTSDPWRRVAIAIDLGRVLMFTARLADAVELLEAERVRLDGIDPDLARATRPRAHRGRASRPCAQADRGGPNRAPTSGRA